MACRGDILGRFGGGGGGVTWALYSELECVMGATIFLGRVVVEVADAVMAGGKGIIPAWQPITDVNISEV